MLAMSSEDDETVEGFLESNGYTVPTSAGATSNSAFGVSGIPDAVIIGPDGMILWRGHPGGLSGGVIKSALKGVKKPSGGGFLSVNSTIAAEGPLAKAVEAAAEGKLARALADARKLADDDSADEAVRADAGTLAREIEAHADMLNAQAASFVQRLDLLKAIEVYETVGKELGAFPAGETAKEQLKAIQKDDKLKKELAALEAFEKTKRSAAKLSTSKKRTQYEQFARRYEGTKAAERAQAWVRAN